MYFSTANRKERKFGVLREEESSEKVRKHLLRKLTIVRLVPKLLVAYQT